MSRTRVLIVDDHPLFRAGVRNELEPHSDLHVIGEAASAQIALDLADTALPDLVLIDAQLRSDNSLDLTRQLKRRHPQMLVVLMARIEDDEQLFQAIRSGAAAYITKDIDPDELVRVLRKVALGEYLINESVLSRPHVASRVLHQFQELSVLDESAEGVFSPLTRREIEILDYVAQGNSNKEIAFQLGISDQTVKNHITSILRKLAVNDRTQAVIFALRHGWIKLDEPEQPEPRLRAVR
ncbi:MAG: response regulator transcription factor [Thermomicrobiales bacterium]|nr:response regulator transcription factor [Thermomicrobiales bacterium]MCO5222501.1 response regulator transcription factor [Thermomicrobiales bacterium]